jgi:uncharacterized protein YndB with AHSA1/START domain
MGDDMDLYILGKLSFVIAVTASLSFEVLVADEIIPRFWHSVRISCIVPTETILPSQNKHSLHLFRLTGNFFIFTSYTPLQVQEK